MVIVDAYNWLRGKKVDKVGFTGRILGGGLGLYVAPEVAAGYVVFKQVYKIVMGSGIDNPQEMFAEASMIMATLSLTSSYVGKGTAKAVVNFFKKIV
jgi:hypothetical protein